MENSDFIKEYYDTSLSVAHKVSNSWHINKFQIHDIFEIYYAMTDDLQYLIGDRIYPVKKGDLFVFNSMDMHRIVVPPNMVYERYVLLFDPLLVKSFWEEGEDLLECFTLRGHNFSHRISLSKDQSTSLLTLFKKIEFYSSKDDYGNKTFRKITLIEILILVNTLYKNLKDTEPEKHDDNFKRVELILNYIDEHLDENISLEHLSSKFYMSKCHLGVIFKKATGTSPVEYIINRRIFKSRELLNNNIPVWQVAQMVGFNNCCHFIRTFTQIVGMSPKQYAKKTRPFYQNNK